MEKPQVISGGIFKIYFDTVYSSGRSIEGRPLACVVIAENVEVAIQKAKAIFPEEIIASAHTDRDYGNQVRQEHIIF